MEDRLEALLLLQCNREHCPTPDDVLSTFDKQVAQLSQRNRGAGQSVLAEMLSCTAVRRFYRNEMYGLFH